MLDEWLNNEDIQNNADLGNDGTFRRLRATLQEDETNEIIDRPLMVNKAEILLAVLKFALVYNLPQTAIADLFKMLNTFFCSKILPDTRYLIDQMFNCNDNVEYHAVCPNCKSYVKKFSRQERNARCNVCMTLISSKDPTYTDFFSIIHTHNEIANLIENNSQYYESVVNDTDRVPEKISDFIDGELYKQFTQSLPQNERKNFVTATFNSDGSPVFESSKFYGLSN